jgi:hypothetical protein
LEQKNHGIHPGLCRTRSAALCIYKNTLGTYHFRHRRHWSTCYNAAKKTSELTAQQKMLNDVNLKAAQEFAEQKTKIEMLVDAIENEKNANEFRRKKINELREIMPSYNGMLDQEGKLINHNTEEIKKYIDALQKQIALKAIEEKLLEKE